MGRELIYNPELTCEICGQAGAYDIYGDYICPDCLQKEIGEKIE